MRIAVLATVIVVTGCATADPEPGVHDRAYLADHSLHIAILDVVDNSRLVNPTVLQKSLAKELSASGYDVDKSGTVMGKSWSDHDAAAAAKARKLDIVVLADVIRVGNDDDRPAAADEGVYLSAGGQERREYYRGGGPDPLDRGPKIRARVRIVRAADEKVVYEASFTTGLAGESEDSIARVLAKPLKKK